MALRYAINFRAIFPGRIPSGATAGVESVASAIQARQISISSPRFLKEITVKEEGNEVLVEGQYMESPRAKLLITPQHSDCNSCPLCALNLNLKHTDVLVLSQFLRADGCMLPRRVTGLCGHQQRRVTLLVAMAQKAGLMPNLAPHWSKKDPKLRYRSKKLNRYFDEATLDP